MTRLTLLCVLLAGCYDADDLDSAHGYDRCVNREIFDACMAALPAGPSRTHYNDWSEIVDSCEQRAAFMSWRLKRDIPAGCR